jgi:hypothetical protein
MQEREQVRIALGDKAAVEVCEFSDGTFTLLVNDGSAVAVVTLSGSQLAAIVGGAAHQLRGPR